MRRIVFAAAVAGVCLPLWAADTKDPINAQEIIEKFAAKETDFSQARNNYTYRQSVKLQELDGGGNPTGGQWELVEDVIFTPEGKRMEKVVYAPVQTLRNILLTPEDEQDLRNVQPFVLTSAEIPEYDISYLGREKVDEIGCYNFSVKPRSSYRGSATSKARSGWTTATCRSSNIRQGCGRHPEKQRTTSSPSSRRIASRSMGNTGSPPTRTPTTRSTSRPGRNASA